MALTDWISLALTATLVGATGYYAREVRRQSKQIVRRERRPQVVELVNTTLLSITSLLRNRSDLADPTTVLSTPFSDDPVESPSAFITLDPIELDSSDHTRLITNRDMVGDVHDLIDRYNDDIDDIADSVNRSIVRLYTEGEQTQWASVLRSIEVAVWDDLIQTATGEEIDITPTNLPDGIEKEDFSFFNFIVRIVEYRMDEATKDNEFIIDLWTDAIEAVEGAESGTDAAELSYLTEVDAGLTDLAADLDELHRTHRELQSEVTDQILSLVDEYNIRGSEVENEDQFHRLYSQ